MTWRRRLKAVAVSALALATAIAPAGPALAWKPKTHVYLAEEAMRDALDNAKVTLFEVDYETGRVLGTLGEFEVDPKALAALRSAPKQFRAGVLGPDAYPDILTGQQIIHPDEAAPPGSGASGSDAWLTYIYDRGFIGSSSPQVNAFALGYLTHAAGDVFAHTFVNYFAGGEFAISPRENAMKHLTLEGYVGQRTPMTTSVETTRVATGTPCNDRKRDDLGLDPGEACGVTYKEINANVTGYDTSIAGVEDFIYRNMVFAQPGTPLMQRLLRGEATNRSLPWLFSNLRNGLQQKVNDYEAQRASLQGPARLAYEATGGPVAAYQRAWIEDIDNGLKALPAFSHEIAQAVVYNEGGADLTKVRDAMGRYQRDHLFSMAGTPDAVVIAAGAISDMINAILPPLAAEALRELMQQPLNLLVWGASGMTPDEWGDYLSRPHAHFDEVMTKAGGAHGGAQDHLIDLATFNRDYLRIDDGGYANPSLKWKTEEFEPAFNTLQLTKMLLLSEAGRRQLEQALAAKGAVASVGSQNIALGWVRSLDAGNQWQALPSKQPGASPQPTLASSGGAAWRKLFMKQVGETPWGEQASEPPAPSDPDPAPAPPSEPVPSSPQPGPAEPQPQPSQPQPPAPQPQPPTPRPLPPAPVADGMQQIARNWRVRFEKAEVARDMELHVFFVVKNVSAADHTITPGTFIPVLINQDGEGITSRAVYRASGETPTEFRPTVPVNSEVRIRYVFRPDPNTAQPRTMTLEAFGETKLSFDVSAHRLGSLLQ